MLTLLRIKNLALVDDLTLEIQPGFNAITGETGAGKSIIIGALNLVLGERADRTLIRAGAESCSVEAVFSTEKLPWVGRFLDENGLEPGDEGQLVVKRTFSAAGANRQFINGSPTSLQVLERLGESLVDMHGPHEHQSLLHPGRQLQIVDAFGELNGLRDEFSRLLQSRQKLDQEKRALIVDEQTYARQLDLLRFQVREIEGAKLKPEDESELEEACHRATNAARLLQSTQEAALLLSESDESILTQMGRLGRVLGELRKVDEGSAFLSEAQEQALSLLQELQQSLGDYADRLDLDPERLQQLEERMNLVQGLKRKYGAAVADVVAFGAEARQKLESLEQRDAELARIDAGMKKIDAELARAGKRLTDARRKLIPDLCKAAMKQLGSLGFRQSRFDIAIKSDPPADLSQASSAGFDSIEFQFAPNVGEPPKPLRAIASSGEMARVMLALKTVLAAQDEIPVLVFDEVDANVGGETASAVGEKMKQIGTRRQVLCITHLAPVAAAGTAHYVVQKDVEGGRTISRIRLLSKSERVQELARMLGGRSAAIVKHAEELLAREE